MLRYLPVLLFVLTPRAVLACPVCFGQSDSPMASAINMGVIVMLGVVVGVLGCFASFIFYLSRRAQLALEPETPTPPQDGAGRLAPRGYTGSNPQEGTAQC